jgi:hypothetical protein
MFVAKNAITLNQHSRFHDQAVTNLAPRMHGSGVLTSMVREVPYGAEISFVPVEGD